jgi:hypothetical protein
MLMPGEKLTVSDCEVRGGCPAANGTRVLVECGEYSYTNANDKTVKEEQCEYEVDQSLADPRGDSEQVTDTHDCGLPCTFDPSDTETRCITAPNGYLGCYQSYCKE